MKSGRLAAALILLGPIVLAGCVENPTNDTTQATTAVEAGSARPLWSSNENGSVLMGFSFSSEVGSACNVALRAQGVSSERGPVAAVLIDEPVWDEDPPRAGLHIFENTNIGFFPTHAFAGAANQSIVAVDEFEYYQHWLVNASIDFESAGTGDVWVLLPAVKYHGTPDDRNAAADAAILGNETATISFSCAGEWRAGAVRHARGAIILTHTPEAGLVHVRSEPGITLAYAGVENAVSWTSKGNSSFYGFIGGDPEKAVVVSLDHPSGTRTWYALPTTYLGAVGMPIGDVFMSYSGPAGKYRLSFSGIGSILFILEAVVIIE